MANYMKATRSSTQRLFDHYERRDGIKFNNQEIDKNKSHLNYNLAESNFSQREILNKRLSEVKVLKRKDVNVICSWLITLPEKINRDTDEEKLFFKKAYEFLSEKYGEKNIVSAYVHKDETTPHMHFCFIPVVIDKNKKIEKVSAKECVTKNDLQKFHLELSDYMKDIFGRDIGILNGATMNGNKTILQMKNEKELFKLENLEKINNEFNEYLKINDEIIKLIDCIVKFKIELDKNNIDLEKAQRMQESLIKKEKELNDKMEDKKLKIFETFKRFCNFNKDEKLKLELRDNLAGVDEKIKYMEVNRDDIKYKLQMGLNDFEKAKIKYEKMKRKNNNDSEQKINLGMKL